MTQTPEVNPKRINYIIVGVPIFLAIIIGTYIFLQYQNLSNIELEEKDKATLFSQSINNCLSVIIQLISGSIVAFTAYIGYQNLKSTQKKINDDLEHNQKNIKISEDKQVAERFSKAIDHLGSDKTDIRLGGIYALEQIAIDSPTKYHWTIVEILSTFIRNNSPVLVSECDSEIESEEASKPEIKLNVDVKAAVAVLGRRKRENDPEGKRIDLRRVNLAGIEVEVGANFSNTDFSGANLIEAKLVNANLSKTNLINANLSGANLMKANLTGAFLFGTNLRKATLSYADLSRAYFTANEDIERVWIGADPIPKGADLREAILFGADLRGAYFTAEQIKQADSREQAKYDDGILE